MAYNFSAGSSEFFRATSVPVTETPLTVACWFNISSVAASRPLVCIEDSTGNNGWRLLGQTDRTLRFATRSGGNTSAADAAATFFTNEWSHACGVTSSATSRKIYLDGNFYGSNTTSRTPAASVTRTTIGSNMTSDFMTGQIAEVGIWNIDLTDQEVSALGQGVSPSLIRPQSLVLYMPLMRNVVELKQGRVFTTGGSPNVTDHPRVYF